MGGLCVFSVKNWLSFTKPALRFEGLDYPIWAFSMWTMRIGNEPGSVKAFVRYIENTGSDS
jgi:hypothetical protein